MGVVGVLQYDVLKFRMQSEYGVGYIQREIPYDIIRYVGGKDVDPSKLKLSAETKWIQDVRGNDLLLFPGNWAVDWALDHNEGLELLPYGSNA